MTQNILLDALPETVEVDGRVFPVNSDFRTGILFEMLIGDGSLSASQKVMMTMSLYYKQDIPDNKDNAINAVLDFYACGKSPNKKRTDTQQQKKAKELIYHFDYDDGYIYAAFLDQYRIELNEIEYLHWWKFHALFRSLKSDNEIVKIMEYRATDLSKIKNKEEKARMAKLKALYALPSNLSFEEKVAVAGGMFGGGLK